MVSTRFLTSFHVRYLLTEPVGLSWFPQRIKYGVVTMDDLCKDLIEWQTLYLSGRMHKPVSTQSQSI